MSKKNTQQGIRANRPTFTTLMQVIFLSAAKSMVVFIAVLLVTLIFSSTVVSQASKSLHMCMELESDTTTKKMRDLIMKS
jgi:hypothetical protein